MIKEKIDRQALTGNVKLGQCWYNCSETTRSIRMPPHPSLGAALLSLFFYIESPHKISFEEKDVLIKQKLVDFYG